MIVPFVDLTRQTNLNSSILSYFKKSIQNGDFILSKELELFEKKFAKFIKVKYAVGVASGTDALLLSLKALNIGKGDEVIIPAMTFIATASAVIHTGAKPVFVDIHPDLSTIDPSLIKNKITNKTKAIIIVHLHGVPCKMDEIKKIAKRHKLFVIEDASQAHGSLYKGKLTGSFGDIAAFSFYPSKNLGAFGDGGAIVTNKKILADRIRLFRNHGEKTKYLSKELGYNSRLDTLQAIVLRKKLRHLTRWNTARRKIAARYNKLLQNLPIQTSIEEAYFKTNYHIYSIRIKKRNALLKFLQNKNISCGVHYPIPLHLQPALKFLGYKKGDFPNAEKFAKENLSLPMFPELKLSEINFIAKCIKKFFKG